MESQQSQEPGLLTREASEYLTRKRGIKISAQTLAKYRSEGGGPKFSMFGRRPIYKQSRLDEYADQMLGVEFANTAERDAFKQQRHRS